MSLKLTAVRNEVKPKGALYESFTRDGRSKPKQAA